MLDQTAIDKALIELDGTPNKTKLGANAILGFLACAKAAAEPGTPGYNYRRRQRQDPARAHDEHPQRRRPCHQQRGDPGVRDHARGRLLLPRGPAHVRRGAPFTPKNVLKENGTPRRRRGDEGGYAQPEEDEDALKVIVKAIEEAGYKPGEDFKIAIDAASEWWNEEEKYPAQSGKKLTQQQLPTCGRSLPTPTPSSP